MGQSKWAWACALIVAGYLAGRLAAQEAIDDPFSAGTTDPSREHEADDPFALHSSSPAPESPSEDGGGEAPTTADEPSVESAEARIKAALDQPLRTPLDFPQTPLSSVMQIIAEEYDIPILFDLPALDAIAQSPETEVTVSLANVSLRSALELMLKNVEDLTYLIDNEVLLITSQDEAESRLLTLVYQIDDLLPRGMRSSDGEGGASPYTSIIEVIARCVERDSWARNNTGEGEICVVEPGVMVITQTQRVHDEVSRLLAEIRRVKSAIGERPNVGY